ncbi:MAG: sortase domain-containing protein [Candidatus Geothermincolia bacterium]
MTPMKRFVISAALVVAIVLFAGCGGQQAIAPEVTAPAPIIPLIPVIEDITPAAGATVARNAAVVITFNTEMDRESLVSAASFEPPLDFEVEMEGKAVSFQPVAMLPKSSSYGFSLKDGTAKSSQGETLSDGASTSFATAQDGMTLAIPRLGYQDPVMEGSDANAVASAIGNGVGHFYGTGRPGGGNVVLFAHCSGIIWFPYNRIMELEPGDAMVLSYGGKDFEYRMEESFVVEQTELWILDPTDEDVITFFVCANAQGDPSPTFHPPYRYVVRAQLVEQP